MHEVTVTSFSVPKSSQCSYSSKTWYLSALLKEILCSGLRPNTASHPTPQAHSEDTIIDWKLQQTQCQGQVQCSPFQENCQLHYTPTRGFSPHRASGPFACCSYQPNYYTFKAFRDPFHTWESRGELPLPQLVGSMFWCQAS